MHPTLVTIAALCALLASTPAAISQAPDLVTTASKQLKAKITPLNGNAEAFIRAWQSGLGQSVVDESTYTLGGQKVYLIDYAQSPARTPGDPEEPETTDEHNAAEVICGPAQASANPSTMKIDAAVNCIVVIDAAIGQRTIEELFKASKEEEGFSFPIGIDTLIHEYAHVLIEKAFIAHCVAQAESWWAANPGSSSSSAGGQFQACMDGLAAWGECMTAASGSDSKNQAEEAFANYAAFLCACKNACLLPAGAEKDLQLAQANSLLADSKADWMDAQAANCTPPLGMVPFPPMPGQTEPWSGPTANTCDCANPPEGGDPCAEVTED